MQLEPVLLRFNEILHRSMGRFSRAAQQKDSPIDVTISQLTYIRTIARLSRPTLSQLAAEMDVSKASASLGAHKLIHRGLVHAECSSHDRRVVHLELTPEGRKLIAAEARAFRELCGFIRDALGEEEIRSLVKLLEKVVTKAAAS